MHRKKIHSFIKIKLPYGCMNEILHRHKLDPLLSFILREPLSTKLKIEL